MVGTPETPIPAPVANFSNTKSIEINGASATGTCTLSGVAFPGPTGCTYSLWINATAPTLAWKIMTMSHASGNTYELLFNGTSAKLLVYEGGTTSATIGSEVIAADTWYHVCITSTSTILGGGDIYMYVNGALVGSGSGTTLTQVTTVTIAPTFAFYGYIDEMAIWDAPLSAAQVATLYTNANGLGGKVSDINDIDITSTAAPRIWNESTAVTTAAEGNLAYSAPDSSNIFVAYARSSGSYGTPPYFGVKIAKSTNSGASWTTAVVDADDNTGSHLSIFAVDANNIFISYLGNSNDFKFARSSDGGSSWTVTTPGPGQKPRNTSVFAVDANTVFVTYKQNSVSGALRFAKSTDGGATFSISTVESPYVGGNSKVYALDSNNIFIIYLDYSGLSVRFATSTNGGSSWTTVLVDSNYPNATSLWVVDINNIYALLRFGTSIKLAKSTDGGASWAVSIPSPPLYSNGAAPKLEALDANTVAISYSYRSAPGVFLAVSIDGGTSWNADLIAAVESDGGGELGLSAISSSSYYVVYWYERSSSDCPIVFASSSVNSALKIWWRMGDLPDDTEGSPGYIYNAAPVPGAGATDNRLEINDDVTITTSGPASYNRFQITTPENSGTGLVPRVLNQKSVTFDGVDAYYASDVGSGPDLNLTAGITISCFVKFNILPAAGYAEAIFGNMNIDTSDYSTGTALTFYAVGISAASAYLKLYVWDGVIGWGGILGGSGSALGTLIPNTWYTLTATLLPGGTLKTYKWGVGKTTISVPSDFGGSWSANRCWSISAWRYGNGVGSPPPFNYFANIKVDECSVYNRALSQSEIIANIETTYYAPDWSTPTTDLSTEFAGSIDAWWRMGDTPGDSETQMISAAGLDAYSTIFNGTDESASSTTDVFGAAGAYSYSCWAKIASIPSTYGTVGHIAYTAWNLGRFWASIYYDGSIYRFHVLELNTDGASASLTSSTILPLALDTWYHLAFTSAGGSGNCSLYVNAVLHSAVAGVAWSATVPSGTLTMKIGDSISSSIPGTNWALDGKIDECALWTRKLPATGSESIASLYNLGTPTDLSSTHSTNLRNWWRMGDASGDNFTTGVLEDVVGTTDMTLTGMDSSNKSTDKPVGNTLAGSGLLSSDIIDEIPIISYAPGGEIGGPYFAPPIIITPTQAPYNPTPTVTGITPASGSDGGGISVTITGTNLIGVTSVTIGGALCTGVVASDGTSIVAVTPASGTTGAKDVVVTTAHGSGTLSNGFTYARFNTKSMDFDGVNDSISTSTPWPELSTPAFSISFWLKTFFQVADNDSLVIGLFSSTTWNKSRFYFRTYGYTHDLPNFGGTGVIIHEGTAASGLERWSVAGLGGFQQGSNWHHYVYTTPGTPGGDALLYINGKLCFTSTNAIAPSGSADPQYLWIGGNSATTEGPANCYVNELSFYDTVLSPANIQTLFNDGVPQDLSVSGLASMKHYYRMGNGPGDSASLVEDQVVGGNWDLDTITSSPALVTDVPHVIVSWVEEYYGLVSTATLITISGYGFSDPCTVEIGGVACTGVVVVDSNTVTAYTPSSFSSPTTEDIKVTTSYGYGTLADGFVFVSSVPSWTNASSMEFDGAYPDGNDISTLAFSNFAVDPASPDYSISFWAKNLGSLPNDDWVIALLCRPETLSQVRMYIRGYTPGAGLTPAPGILIAEGDSSLQSASWGYSIQSRGGTFSDDLWHHYVYTTVGTAAGAALFYIDGVLFYTSTGQDLVASPDPVKLFVAIKPSDTSAHNTAEGISDLALFGDVLTPSEITTIYNDGAPTDISAHSGIEHYYRFGDGIGDTATISRDQVGHWDLNGPDQLRPGGANPPVLSSSVPYVVISSIFPYYGLTSTATSITIKGFNFVGVTSVTIGGAACTWTVTDANTIVGTTPASFGSDTTEDLAVITSSGTGTLSDAFVFRTTIPAWENLNSVEFDGTTNDLSTRYAGPALDTVSPDYSVSFWAKIDIASFSSGDRIFSMAGPLGSLAVSLGRMYIRGYTTGATVPGTQDFLIAELNADTISPSSTWAINTAGMSTVADANWHHYVYTSAGTTGGATILYIDGASFKTGTGKALTANPCPVYMTLSRDPSSYLATTGVACNMDEIAIFSDILTPVEVAAIWNTGTPTDISGHSGIQNYWRMGDGPGDLGTFVRDQVGIWHLNAPTGTPVLDTDVPT